MEGDIKVIRENPMFVQNRNVKCVGIILLVIIAEAYYVIICYIEIN